jgi:hypothetical protein
MAPKLACVQWQRADEQAAHVAPHTEAEPLLRAWLEDTTLVHTGANIAYDFGVVCANFPDLTPLVFRAYEEDRVTDVQIRQKLLDIVSGRFQGFLHKGVWTKPRYSLDDLSRRYGFGPLEKGVIVHDDGSKGTDWNADRFGYGMLRDVPFADWPARALAYARRDAEVTLGVHMLQAEHEKWIPTQYHEARAAFALHLASAWGLRTDPTKVAALREATVRERDEVQARLIAAGIVRPDGSRDTKRAAAHMVATCRAEGRPLRLTDGGSEKLESGEETIESLCAKGQGIALDADACEETEDPILQDYARFTTLGTILNKDVKALEGGVRFPIHTRFGMAASGRTTSASPNIQNWKR